LLVLETGRTTGFDAVTPPINATVLNFPAMPDSIELARSADYTVVNSQVMPDGIHQYKWTNPLNIPFSFKLHSFDPEFCPRGALSLLEVAALLHSFSVPLSKTGVGTKVFVSVKDSRPDAERGGSQAALESSGQSTDNPYVVTPDTQHDFSPPVTLRLDIIYVDESSPGISCIGYVKDVKAKLNGPWLRGPNNSYNLPSSGDFEFTFVHVPGHGNDYSITTNTVGSSAYMAQAYGDDVEERLYNTQKLGLESGRGYTGFKNNVPPPRRSPGRRSGGR
jgi:hypothetical protein